MPILPQFDALPASAYAMASLDLLSDEVRVSSTPRT